MDANAGHRNLIVKTCRQCDIEKAQLEKDLSAISMRPDLAGQFPFDERLIAEAVRKETAKSDRTGKAVRDSAESQEFTQNPMPGVSFSFGMIAGPQVDPKRVYRLAQFHIAAFFFWITFDLEKGQGDPIPGRFVPAVSVRRPDWGNPQILGFQEAIKEWPHGLHVVAADGYFKAIIRQSPVSEPPLWAWALEWNNMFRVAGFFGDGQAAQLQLDRLPVPEWRPHRTGVDKQNRPFTERIRKEIPVSDNNDRLFDMPSADDPSADRHAGYQD